VKTLPPAWFYPELASARIILDGQSYPTPEFQEGSQRLVSDIVIAGLKRGSVEVNYSKEMPELDEGPFLKEERSLIDTITQELALIIERRRSAEEKIKLEEQLRHADRLATIGQLSAGVAHELNEPLSNILGFAQLVKKDTNLSKQTIDDIEKIITASLHSREVIKKLLFFARQMPIRKEPTKLNQIVEEGMYFLKSRCDKEGIEVVYSLTPDLPEIYADHSQLNQILVNLVVNAIQAMPGGGRLTIKTTASDDSVALIVEDAGIGMTEDVIKKVFIPFFTTKDVGQGTGLGLSVVHGIVTAHGGAIKVDSKPKQGSRFEVTLPVKTHKPKMRH
jgi:signal transduction histidine kinase